MQDFREIMIHQWRRQRDELALIVKNLDLLIVEYGGKKHSAALTITDAIRRAIVERPRTGSEVADCVLRVLPHVDRHTVLTIIAEEVRNGELAKDNNLKLFIGRPLRKKIS